MNRKKQVLLQKDPLIKSQLDLIHALEGEISSLKQWRRDTTKNINFVLEKSNKNHPQYQEIKSRLRQELGLKKLTYSGLYSMLMYK